MEGWPPAQRVAVNTLNKQPWRNYNGWPFSLEVGHGADNPSP
jgi:hypothetical protein